MNCSLGLIRDASGVSFLKSHPAAAVFRAAAASAVLDMHPFVLGDEKQLPDVVLCRAAAVLSSAEALGIDVEWRPTGSQGGGQKASILQVPHALPHVLLDPHQASYTASLLPFCACCKAQRSLTSTTCSVSKELRALAAVQQHTLIPTP